MQVLHPQKNILHVTLSYQEGRELGLEFPTRRVEESLRNVDALDSLLTTVLEKTLPEAEWSLFRNFEQYFVEIDLEVDGRSEMLRVVFRSRLKNDLGQLEESRQLLFEFEDLEDVLDFCHAFREHLPDAALSRFYDRYYLDFLTPLPEFVEAQIWEYGTIPEVEEVEIYANATTLIDGAACEKLNACFPEREEDLEEFRQHIHQISEWLLGS
jgi:negative regulator of genetic competence, sporulation and motility